MYLDVENYLRMTAIITVYKRTVNKSDAAVDSTPLNH